MSAVVLVLPRLWATAAVEGWQANAAASAASNAARRPQRLHLVQGAAAEAASAPAAVVPKPQPRPELAFYRKYTEAMLRRYQTMSMEAGRVPSLLGREMFRGKVTSYKVRAFDDVVIFVHDVGQCLERLSPGQQHLVRRIALQEYTQAETAAMIGVSLRTVSRRYGGALDRLTELFLERKMLELQGGC